jgi:hypothetical protein
MADAVRAARDAGAVKIWTELLYLRPGTREHFLDTLSVVWPSEAARLAADYANRAYAPREAVQANFAGVARLAREFPRRASAPPWIEPDEPPRFAVQLGFLFDDTAADSSATRA